MSLDQRSPGIPTQLENLCGLLPWGSRQGKRRNSYMMLRATESFELDCHCMKSSKAPCYLTINVGLKKEPSFMGYLLMFGLSEALYSSMQSLVVWPFGGLWDMQHKCDGGTDADGNAHLFAPSHMQGDGWKQWKHIYGIWRYPPSCSAAALNIPCWNNANSSASQGGVGSNNRKGLWSSKWSQTAMHCTYRTSVLNVEGEKRVRKTGEKRLEERNQ